MPVLRPSEVTMSVFRAVPALLLIGLAALLAACGSSDSSSSSSAADTTAAASAADTCAKDQLALKTPGQLTVATDKPAYPPYFEDDDPANGKGFESAVAYAIAKQLGFAPTEVKWVVVPFDASYAPGDKKFDFDVNQISITDARKKVVDFSTPYYTAPQAIIVAKGSPFAGKTSLADFKTAQIGVQIGTTSLDAVTSQIMPSAQPKVFNNSNDVVAAFKQKQVDAIVTDLPTALYLTAVELDNGVVAGQFSAPGGDQWGALLQKGSALTPCVDKAIDAMKSDGELDNLTMTWMAEQAGAPELK
ncbi:MAG: transporter substrate-binding domain-containing protein [Gaiellales bacterium]